MERYPLSKPEEITASSRRSFLEQAKARDQSIREQVGPIIDGLKADREKIREEERLAAREEVGKAWGSPTTGISAGPIDESQMEKRMENARRTRNLKESVLALMDGRGI